MGYYDDGYGNSFFPAIYITEDKVLERQAQALRDQGWAVIEISCKKHSSLPGPTGRGLRNHPSRQVLSQTPR